jgi:hypothetical protein
MAAISMAGRCKEIVPTTTRRYRSGRLKIVGFLNRAPPRPRSHVTGNELLRNEVDVRLSKILPKRYRPWNVLVAYRAR